VRVLRAAAARAGAMGKTGFRPAISRRNWRRATLPSGVRGTASTRYTAKRPRDPSRSRSAIRAASSSAAVATQTTHALPRQAGAVRAHDVDVDRRIQPCAKVIVRPIGDSKITATIAKNW
jgi:hypothetical protein